MDKNSIIYSQNFKQWFGDWENNPQISSKVVDENGFPLVVYHGTDAEFSEFKTKFIGQLGTQHGQGFYFTSNKKFAENFGKNIKSFFLNIRKPLSTNELTLSYNDCIKLMDAIDKKQCEADPEFGYGILSDYGDIDIDGRENVLKSAVDLEYSSSDNDVEIVGSLINTSGDYNIVVNTLYELFGYDGILCPEREIYVIHHPNQAKEISNQLFNPDSNNMYESKKTKRIFVTETQYKQLINESQESKSIDAAKKLLISNGYSPEQADKFIRIDLRNDIPSLSDSKNAKFILGVTRMFLNRELSDATTILNIDKTIKLLTLAHYNEYDRNLNGLSAEELINRFADARSEHSKAKRNALSTRQFEQRDYNIVKINSFEEASDYSNYTSWCVTRGEGAFNSYTAGGEAQFYFCLKNGFENIKQIEGENCPLDEYGLSMIAVCVDGDGDLKTCTCRWNHDKGGNDKIMNEEQISNVIGVNFYQVFKPSNVLKEKIEALKGMTEIPNKYFYNSKIKEIIIPNNITLIGVWAFSGCKNLTSVTIPDSVNEIGIWAFFDCTSLTSITIPDSVTSIEGSAFSRCTSLTSVTIPDSVTSIGEEAFYGCYNLTSVTIPNSVTTIGEGAFYYCRSLTSITIGNSVTSIGYGAFAYCKSLTSVTIPIRFKDEINDIFGETNANFKFYGQQNESLIKKTRRIFVTETQLDILKQHINESNNNYFVDTNKVLIVKKFMDKMFSRGKMNSMSPNGYPTKTNVIGMKGNDGEVIKNMSFEQVLYLLEDKFHYIYTNEDKRSRFLKQILKDWYNKKITNEGLLSVNYF